jgi:DNA replication protein DnaC
MDIFILLAKAENEDRYLRTFNDLAKAPLLILDDLLVFIPTIKQVQTLLELVERRACGGSTIICILLHASDWQQRIVSDN